MNKPSIDVLLNKVDSKYSLIVATAKRARMLAEGAPALIDIDSTKPVTIALYEVAEGKLEYVRTQTGIK